MRYFTPESTDMKAPVMAQGCMRIAGLSDRDLDALISADLESGINFFDHADIYAGGKCEEKFGSYLRRHPTARDGMIIQTKCGIVRGRKYDFTPEYILSCVDGSLKRLGTDRIDVLLLHRPDALCEPDAVAEAFDKLRSSGKVKYFGVSNHNSFQIELLQRSLKEKLVFDQLQFGPAHSLMVSSGMHVNMRCGAAVVRDGMTLDYCRLRGVTIQPWSPMGGKHALVGGRFGLRLGGALKKLGARYDLTESAAALAWILRHPANMQPVFGSTDPGRVRAMAKAADVTITHSEWYDIYRAAGNDIP